MNGIALTVLISSYPAFRRLDRKQRTAKGPVGHCHLAAGGKRQLDGVLGRRGHAGGHPSAQGSRRVPGILIAVVGATLIVGALDLGARADVSVLGTLPQGLPSFTIPWITYADIGPVMIGGLAVAWCRSPTPACSRAPIRQEPAPTSTLTRRWSGSGPPTWQPGSFRVFPSAAVHHAPPCRSRGSQNPADRCRRRARSGFAAPAGAHLLKHLPSSALAAVVIASAIGLIEIADLRRIFRIQRWSSGCRSFVRSAWLCWARSSGIGMAIVIAVIEFLWTGGARTSQSWARAEGVKGYHDITRYPDARLIPGLSCSAGMRPCSLPTPNCSVTVCWTQRRVLQRRYAGWL